MAGDEVRDELLPQSFFAIDAVEYLFEFLEQAEWGFAHDAQHSFAGMLWSYFQTSTDVSGYQFTGIFSSAFIGFRIFAPMQ